MWVAVRDACGYPIVDERTKGAHKRVAIVLSTAKHVQTRNVEDQSSTGESPWNHVAPGVVGQLHGLITIAQAWACLGRINMGMPCLLMLKIHDVNFLHLARDVLFGP